MKSPLLLIDDDDIFRQTLARSLSRRGYHIYQAASLEQLQNYSEAPQAAIVDLKLAESSGLDVLPVLRKRYPNLHIVMLTGYASIATAVEAVKRGADQYLCKPADIKELLLAIEGEPANSSEELEDLKPLSVDRLEWEHIQQVLQRNQGNISATARELNMHRRTLQRKLAKKPVAQ